MEELLAVELELSRYFKLSVTDCTCSWHLFWMNVLMLPLHLRLICASLQAFSSTSSELFKTHSICLVKLEVLIPVWDSVSLGKAVVLHVRRSWLYSTILSTSHCGKLLKFVQRQSSMPFYKKILEKVFFNEDLQLVHNVCVQMKNLIKLRYPFDSINFVKGRA